MPKRSTESGALYLALDELARYVRHQSGCNGITNCSCGLSALLDRAPLRGLVYKLSTDLEMDDIVHAAADHYRVNVREVLGRRQYQGVARPRRVSMYVARTLIGSSYPVIGKFFSRDHSTVIAACRRVASDLRARPGFQGTIDHVAQRARRRAGMRDESEPRLALVAG